MHPCHNVRLTADYGTGFKHLHARAHINCGMLAQVTFRCTNEMFYSYKKENTDSDATVKVTE